MSLEVEPAGVRLPKAVPPDTRPLEAWSPATRPLASGPSAVRPPEAEPPEAEPPETEPPTLGPSEAELPNTRPSTTGSPTPRPPKAESPDPPSPATEPPTTEPPTTGPSKGEPPEAEAREPGSPDAPRGVRAPEDVSPRDEARAPEDASPRDEARAPEDASPRDEARAPEDASPRDGVRAPEGALRGEEAPEGRPIAMVLPRRRPRLGSRLLSSDSTGSTRCVPNSSVSRAGRTSSARAAAPLIMRPAIFPPRFCALIEVDLYRHGPPGRWPEIRETGTARTVAVSVRIEASTTTGDRTGMVTSRNARSRPDSASDRNDVPAKRRTARIQDRVSADRGKDQGPMVKWTTRRGARSDVRGLPDSLEQCLEARARSGGFAPG
jgi:hypothetical protein